MPTSVSNCAILSFSEQKSSFSSGISSNVHGGKYLKIAIHEDIGNRKTEIANGTSKTFLPNLVNQYTAIGPKALTYDADGNLLSDGTWTYAWNGENQLVTMTRATVQKLDFAYDFMGRRFSKKVYSWSGTAWVLAKETRFVYDGWNLLAELSSANAFVKSFTWGLDLSGSEQGAGGVGGLLAMRVESSGLSYYYSYDGNGNVSALVNSGTGSVQMAYEYSPFGQVLVGGLDVVNPFKFSTKYQDAETGLNYYGYRYYSADMGRWLNRDPIEEEGGVGLYSFNFNNALNLIDYLGAMPVLPGGIAPHPVGVPSGNKRTEPPSTATSLIPIVGSLASAEYYAGQGDYGWASFNYAMAASDVFLLKSIGTGLGKGCWKLGSHSWSATKSWYKSTRNLENNIQVHHWLAQQKGNWGRHLPDWIKNQPWNLIPIPKIGSHSSQTVHLAVHGRSRKLTLTWYERAWYGTPSWVWNMLFNGSAKTVSSLEKIGDADKVIIKTNNETIVLPE